MAQNERTTSAQSTQPTLAPVRVYEYVVPSALVGPPRVAVAGAPRRPVPADVLLLYRWIQRHYGLR